MDYCQVQAENDPLLSNQDNNYQCSKLLDMPAIQNHFDDYCVNNTKCHFDTDLILASLGGPDLLGSACNSKESLFFI